MMFVDQTEAYWEMKRGIEKVFIHVHNRVSLTDTDSVVITSQFTTNE